MNESAFTSLLDQLDHGVWQSAADGQGLLMVDDTGLQAGPAQAPNVIIPPPDPNTLSAEELKRQSLSDAGRLLADYYRTHPLTRSGFNRQVERLIEQQGAAAFAAPQGALPQRTLFVDGGEVVAEPASSPRHRYGVFCELERPLEGAALATRLHQWLQQGTAYERYLSMNVCRYNC